MGSWIRMYRTWGGSSDGNWSTYGVWLGDPPQLFHALVSTSGTALKIPISPLCHGDGAFEGNASDDTSLRKRLLEWKLNLRDTMPDPRDATEYFVPQHSRTWQSTSGCSRGTDTVIAVMYEEVPRMVEVYQPTPEMRIPVERLDVPPSAAYRSQIAFIGLGAVATYWNGERDYWWAVLIQSKASLFQSIPFLDFSDTLGRYQPVSGVHDTPIYTYTAGAWYRMSECYLPDTS